MEDKMNSKLLEKYLEGATSEEEENWLFEHSPELKMEGDFYEISRKLTLPAEFDTQIEDQLINGFQNVHQKRRYWPIAASFTLAILSFVCGMLFQQRNDGQLKAELYSVRALMSDMLVEQQSAHIRLKAIETISGLGSLDNDELHALVMLMNNDENQNVRLAAVNLLSTKIEIPFVADTLLASLKTQDDFLVRAASIHGLLQHKKYHQALLKLMNESDDELKTQIKDGIKNS